MILLINCLNNMFMCWKLIRKGLLVIWRGWLGWEACRGKVVSRGVGRFNRGFRGVWGRLGGRGRSIFKCWIMLGNRHYCFKKNWFCRRKSHKHDFTIKIKSFKTNALHLRAAWILESPSQLNQSFSNVFCNNHFYLQNNSKWMTFQ